MQRFITLCTAFANRRSGIVRSESAQVRAVRMERRTLKPSTSIVTSFTASAFMYLLRICVVIVSERSSLQ